MSNKIRVRFAPSPTGFLHVGGIRTALFNYLFAKHESGDFLLRIEDTDRARYVDGAVEQIKAALLKYGLVPDNISEPVVQSERLAIYKRDVLGLAKQGLAYECFCTPERLEKLRADQTESRVLSKYDRHCLNMDEAEKQKLREQGVVPVMRMKIPEGETSFADLIFGKITVKNELLDDQVLMKSDGYPTYHLANVIDDHEMDITHVIRGEEWVPSTPKHVILYKMFGWPVPIFAHLPLIVKPDHKKLSKRDQAADANLYPETFETEAITNYIAFLGWNPKTVQEIFSLEELAASFALEKVNRSSSIFDLVKLNWLNHQWILKKGIAQSQFFKNFRKFAAERWHADYSEEYLLDIAGLILERVEDFWKVGDLLEKEFSFFFVEPDYAPDLLLWKKDPSRAAAAQNLQKFRDYLAGADPTLLMNPTDLETGVKLWIHENRLGVGEVLWPARAALSGLPASPSPFEIISALARLEDGKDLILKRLDAGIAKL